MVFILTSMKGLDGIWYAYAGSDLLSGLLGLLMLIYELKVFKIIIANEKATSLS